MVLIRRITYLLSQSNDVWILFDLTGGFGAVGNTLRRPTLPSIRLHGEG